MIQQYEQVTIATGETVQIRRANSYDVERIRDMYARSSEYSITMRFLSYTQPTLESIEAMVNLPPSQGKALVAVVASGGIECVIGYAYYVRNANLESFVAEPAIMIEDSFQGLGLGHALCEALIEEACQQHIQVFDMTISLNNDAMMGVIRKSGLNYTQSFVDGTRNLYLSLSSQLTKPSVSEENISQLIDFLTLEPA